MSAGFSYGSWRRSSRVGETFCSFASLIVASICIEIEIT